MSTQAIFNKGWMCANCGPVQEVESKTKLKIKRTVCKTCDAVVTEWERPLNERPGRCSNCTHGSFELELVNGHIIRKCKKCDEISNAETGEILKQGKEELKYEL